MPSEGIDPLRWRWIKASFVAALISAVGSLIIYGEKQLTGAGVPDAGTASLVLHLGAMVVISAIDGAVYGILTGAVLQRALPSLPVVGWMVLHAAMIVLGVLVVEALESFPFALEAAENSPDSAPVLRSRIGLALLGLVLGAVLGVAIGSLQALVLRRAAQGVRAWITYSTLAYAAAYGVLMLIVGDWEPPKDFIGELISQVQTIAAAVFVAIIMVPALERLAPRSS